MRSQRFLPLLVVCLSACSDAPSRVDAISEAFVGPMTLNLRQEIGLKSGIAATVKHGERLEVLSTRRRFFRVRTSSGVEGWVDSEKLLTPNQMERLRAVAEAAQKLPVQGEATVYEARNVHTEPHRQSPSFTVLKEEERFFVVGHKLVPRGPYDSEINKVIEKATAPPPRKKASRKSKDRSGRDSDVELPLPPAPPPVPSNWREMGFRNPPEEEPPPAPKKEERALSLLIRPPQEPPKFEEWSLIRTKDGRAGWILTRTHAMTIPDEVGRYAEGHRITSWFVLGEVKDGEETKKQYLWTTITKGGEPYEYDGFRIFVYSTRRHRYETGYREKNVRGYYPSALHPVQVTEGKKTFTTQGFSLVLEDESGNLVRKTYSFEGYRTRLIATEPWKKLDDPLDLKALAITKPTGQAQESEPGFWERMKRKLPWNSKS